MLRSAFFVNNKAIQDNSKPFSQFIKQKNSKFKSDKKLLALKSVFTDIFFPQVIYEYEVYWRVSTLISRREKMFACFIHRKLNIDGGIIFILNGVTRYQVLKLRLFINSIATDVTS